MTTPKSLQTAVTSNSRILGPRPLQGNRCEGGRTCVLEISRQSYPDYDSILENPPNNANEQYVQTAFSYRHDFWNQTLHLNSFALMLGESWNKGATARVGLDYDWFDTFSVGGGWLVYQKGSDSEYASSTSLAYAEQMSRNDRIFLETAYSF